MREDFLLGLRSFNSAVASGAIKPRIGELHKDILVFVDRPNGDFRLSYGLVRDGVVVAMATLAQTDPIDGVPCYQINYAVEPKNRGRGYALSVSKAAIAEAKHGLGRNGVKKWAVEAVVDADNKASLVVAGRLFLGESEIIGTDDEGITVHQFIMIV